VFTNFPCSFPKVDLVANLDLLARQEHATLVWTAVFIFKAIVVLRCAWALIVDIQDLI
jgi:hypothetical protein